MTISKNTITIWKPYFNFVIYIMNTCITCPLPYVVDASLVSLVMKTLWSEPDGLC